MRQGWDSSAAFLEPSRRAMQRTLALATLAASLFALSATAQTGRTMRLLAPVEIGQSSGFVMDHPPSIAGNSFGFAMCSPTFPGAIPVSVPGVVQGTLRLTPLGYSVVGIGILDSSGTSAAFTFTVPNNPVLVGATFDVQGADVDGIGFMSLTDNDLEVLVAAPPPGAPNPIMVAIAPGTFQLGSPVTPLNVAPYYNQANAQPVHTVTITQPFWIGNYEVTQAEYQAVMGSNPSYFQGPLLPVVTVSWSQAVAYCDALTVQEAAAGRLPAGYEYRLPTEAEWEYCCRAGTTTEWSVGDSLNCAQANVGCENQPSAVGSYLPNAWGLHDMHGNVWEWCLDTWDGSANYPAGSTSDPYVTAGSVQRVIRGGSWFNSFNDYHLHRSAFRYGAPLAYASNAMGFRVVCAPVLP